MMCENRTIHYNSVFMYSSSASAKDARLWRPHALAPFLIDHALWHYSIGESVYCRLRYCYWSHTELRTLASQTDVVAVAFSSPTSLTIYRHTSHCWRCCWCDQGVGDFRVHRASLFCLKKSGKENNNVGFFLKDQKQIFRYIELSIRWL